MTGPSSAARGASQRVRLFGDADLATENSVHKDGALVVTMPDQPWSISSGDGVVRVGALFGLKLLVLAAIRLYPCGEDRGAWVVQVKL